MTLINLNQYKKIIVENKIIFFDSKCNFKTLFQYYQYYILIKQRNINTHLYMYL